MPPNKMAAVSAEALAMPLRLPRARVFSGAATQAPSAEFQRLRCVLFMREFTGRSGTHACGAHVAGNAA
jgi:hypothetical protein